MKNKESEMNKIIVCSLLLGISSFAYAMEKITQEEQKELNEALIKAVREVNIKETERLLDEGAEIDYQIVQYTACTPLIYAIIPGNLDMVRVLLDRNANVDLQDFKDYTALTVAVKYDKVAIVRMLLDKGADVDLMTHRGATALLIATRNGYDTITEMLLYKNPNINHQDCSRRTALMNAVEHDNVAFVRMLLYMGANTDLRNSDGETALSSYSMSSNPVDSIKLLIAHGMHINGCDKYGGTAVMRAAWYGKRDIVKLLTEMTGAVINLKDTTGMTALDYARDKGHDDIAQLLRDVESDKKKEKLSNDNEEKIDS